MDRNALVAVFFISSRQSPPARVAWIEIERFRPDLHQELVATREGGVDRNYSLTNCQVITSVATREGGVDRNSPFLSARSSAESVATREGGVDRNALHHSPVNAGAGRHPRGWRG